MTNSTEIVTGGVERWRLVEVRKEGTPSVIALSGIPQTVGRVNDALVCLNYASISKRHAEIRMGPSGPVVHDLNSTNGTFVNGERVDQAELAEGDVVRFANCVFKVERLQDCDFEATADEETLPWVESLIRFDALMDSPGPIPNYQPIVHLRRHAEIVGYEMLARSDIEGLKYPQQMFATAKILNQEVSLSILLRETGVRSALTMASPGSLFLNTSPNEVGDPRFLDSLGELRRLAPSLPITIEIHEAAVTGREQMRTLADRAGELDMRIAYDDFGAGQARLDELAECPPDVLKFDIQLVRGIDGVDERRLRMIESLVEVSRSLGATTLAEGVETRAEAVVCRQLGFDLAQGFLFGRPKPLSVLAIE